MKRDKIHVNDRQVNSNNSNNWPKRINFFPPPPHCPQLACARISSQEGQDYLKGMAAAANYAWVNRSSMTFLTRQVHSLTKRIHPYYSFPFFEGVCQSIQVDS